MAEFNLPFGVRVSNSDPLDADRYIQEDVSGRNALLTEGRAYEGLITYVKSDNKIHLMTDASGIWTTLLDASSITPTVINDNILDWDDSSKFYAPYTSRPSGVGFFTGTDLPTSTSIVKFNGKLGPNGIYTLMTSGGDYFSIGNGTGTYDVYRDSRYGVTLGSYLAINDYTNQTTQVNGNSNIDPIKIKINFAPTTQLGNTNNIIGSFYKIDDNPTTIGTKNYGILDYVIDASHYVVLNPRILDSSSAVMFKISSFTDLSINGSKLLQLSNNEKERFSIDKDGNVNVPLGSEYRIGGVPIGDSSGISLAWNGLNNINSSIGIGGLLNDTTIIDISTFMLMINTTLNVSENCYFSMINTSGTSMVALGTDTFSIAFGANGGINDSLQLTSDAGVFVLTRDNLTISSTTGEGLKYGADYSAGFTERSLVDKGWVYATIDASVPAINYKYINGLSKSGNNISLGGKLGTYATIDLSLGSGVFEIQDFTYSTIWSKFSSPTFGSEGRGGQFYTASYLYNTAQKYSEFTVNPGQIIFKSNASTGESVTIRLNPTGLVYDTDYSSYFSARTLIDKGYADNIIKTLDGSLSDGTPTNAEITAVIGLDASTAGTNYKAIIKDIDGTQLHYFITSDGSDWFYTQMARAI